MLENISQVLWYPDFMGPVYILILLTSDFDLETSLNADGVDNAVSESTFEIIDRGSERGHKKLVESNGFMYGVKKV